jgi:hypothetical protein
MKTAEGQLDGLRSRAVFWDRNINISRIILPPSSGLVLVEKIPLVLIERLPFRHMGLLLEDL